MELREDLLKEALPEEYATLAIERMEDMGYTDVDAAESLLGAFCWDYSGESFPSESHIFWF